MKKKLKALGGGLSIALAICFAFYMGLLFITASPGQTPPALPLGFIAENQVSDMTPDNAQRMVLTGHFDRSVPEGEPIHLYLSKLSIRMLLNGRALYALDAEDHPHMVRSIGTQWVCFDSPGIAANDTIEITLQNDYPGNRGIAHEALLKNLFTGDAYALMQMKMHNHLPQILIAAFIIVIAIIFLSAIATLKLIKAPVPDGYASCGMLLLCGAACTFINYQYVTLLIPNAFWVNALDNVLQLFICYFLLKYMRGCLHGERLRSLATVFVDIWMLLMIAHFLLQGTGVIDSIEMLGWLLPACAALILLTSAFLVLEYKKRTSPGLRIMLYSGLFVALCALIETVNYYVTHEYWIYLFQFSLFLFSIVQFAAMMRYTRESIKRAQRAEAFENELIASRLSLAINQVQPHFIFNALNAISGLCLINPAKADEAIISFSNYLRSNYDALTSREPLPFDAELEHIRHYLSLQQLRYGSKLKVACEIGESNFFIPALTIQTVVESAARRGLSTNTAGCQVLIKTTRQLDSVLIEVISDSPCPEIDQPLPPELENARTRLKLLAGYEMRIERTADGGTRATILAGYAGRTDPFPRPDPPPISP